MIHFSGKDLLDFVVPAVPALLAFIQSSMNSKKIKEVHIDINSRVTELVEAIKNTAHATGMAAGIEQERQRREAEKKQ